MTRNTFALLSESPSHTASAEVTQSPAPPDGHPPNTFTPPPGRGSRVAPATTHDNYIHADHDSFSLSPPSLLGSPSSFEHSSHSQALLSPHAAPFNPTRPHSLDRVEHNLEAIRSMASILTSSPTSMASMSSVTESAMARATSPLLSPTATPFQPTTAKAEDKVEGPLADPKQTEPSRLTKMTTCRARGSSILDRTPSVTQPPYLPKYQPNSVHRRKLLITRCFGGPDDDYVPDRYAALVSGQSDIIYRITAENASLRETSERDRGTIEELTSLSKSAKSANLLEARVKELEKGLKLANVELAGVKNSHSDQSKTGPALSAELKTQLEGVCEMQKMQSTSISAVVGQVGSLEKLLNGTAGALGKEIQALSATSSDEVKKIQRTIEKIESKLEEYTQQADAALPTTQANAVAGHDRLTQMEVKLDTLLTAVNGIEKRAQQQAAKYDVAFRQIRDEVADLKKRADEAVVVTDSRSAVIDSKVNQLKDDVAAIKAQPAVAHSEHVGRLAKLESGLATCKENIIWLSESNAAKTEEDNYRANRQQVSSQLSDLFGRVIALEGRDEECDSGQVKEAAQQYIDEEMAALRNEFDDVKADQEEKFTESLTRYKQQVIANRKVENMVLIVEGRLNCELPKLHGQYSKLKSRIDDLAADCHNQLATQNSEHTVLKDQISVLEARADDAASIDAVLARIQAARDASQADQSTLAAELHKEIKRVEAANAAIVKGLEGRFDTGLEDMKASTGRNRGLRSGLAAVVGDVKVLTSRVNAMEPQAPMHEPIRRREKTRRSDEPRGFSGSPIPDWRAVPVAWDGNYTQSSSGWDAPSGGDQGWGVGADVDGW